jgi:hypothetical protein
VKVFFDLDPAVYMAGFAAEKKEYNIVFETEYRTRALLDKQPVPSSRLHFVRYDDVSRQTIWMSSSSSQVRVISGRTLPPSRSTRAIVRRLRSLYTTKPSETTSWIAGVLSWLKGRKRTTR